MQPRAHHYAFSHVFLPKQAESTPDKLLSELRGPMREGFLFFLWQQLGQQMGAMDDAAGLGVAGVDEQDGDTYVLLTMPPPQNAGESLFVAIVHRPGRTQLFVLDRSVDGGGSLAKLSADGGRLSYGALPATQEAFLARVVELVRTEPDASASPSAAPAGAVWGAAAQTLSKPSAPASSPGVGAVWGDAAKALPGPAAPQPGAVWGDAAKALPGPAASQPGAVWAAPAQTLSKPGAVWGAAGPVGKGPGRPAKKGGVSVLGIGCIAVVVLFCLVSSVIGYESPTDFESDPFTVRGHVQVTPAGEETAVLTLEGGPEWAYYDVAGQPSCGLSPYRRTCELPLGDGDGRTLRYEVTGSGTPRSLFGIRLGGMPRSTQTAVVDRPTGLAWSDARSATVCRGARCEIVLEDGELQLRDAPAGATIRVGGGAPGASAGVDLVSLADTAGLGRVLAATQGERASVHDVAVTLTDGTSIEGSVEIPLNTLRSALIGRWQQLGDARLGPASGDASIWIEDGQLRGSEGSPARVSDVRRVLVATTEQVSAGTCGPYIGGLSGSPYLPRTRTETSVVVFDRRDDRVVTRRTFRSPTPRCPEWISSSQTSIGQRDTSDADEYARTHMTDA